MTVEVGYITSWRRAIFFSLVGAIVLFGLASTICSAYVGITILGNIISVGVLIICIGIFILVIADKNGKYTGKGTGDINDGIFIYSDKKRHYEIALNDIKKVDIETITMGNSGGNGKTVAYRILIKTDKKKYYIESDRAAGREYNEVDLYRLYIYLQENLQA